MKYLWLLLLAFPFAAFNSVHTNSSMVAASPLSNYSPEWSLAKYSVCNTAANVTYMSAEEKKLIYIINLMRTNPVLFANTVISKYPDSAYMTSLKNSTYYKSLLVTLRRQEPLGVLYPDSTCYVSASCHAITAGKNGYVGHERQTEDCKKKWVFNGECCDYGHNQALDILMSLLIDDGVPSLGHRKICLSPYNKIGVSLQPHTTYSNNTVLDFLY
jgi:uncharacterized protein YkwD